MRIKRAEKYGFCAGVRIADRKVKKFAAAGGRGAILGQVVHNERVVREMEELGVRTVESLDEVRDGTIVFSAHGVPPSFLHTARRRGLQVLDTTCPFVYDVHDDAQAALRQGLHLAFIGDPRHREILGYTHDLDPAAYHVISTVEEATAVDWAAYPGVRILYQTTLNADEYEAVARAIEERGGNVSRTDTICYATKENQEAALRLAEDPEVQAILVIGGKRSANTRHLWEICERLKPSYLVHGPEDLRPEWLAGVDTLGVTAGASTPDYLIDEVEEAALALQGRRRGDLVSAVR
ncbi:MAG TPA: 4-hydroxy-3-methylbut-2-enyl diphosphate reductase [Thermoanaerobaculia bacterium]|jgi:4-hydroxy-3-methylbut-2-enyl diphosphate reductase|nr:4-hydroxy-3-methylbut-2-enyl diphosphate reductase [Thermoanaerobaculia bacterium]